MNHPTLPQPGEVLGGKYRIVRTIGEGGMGIVYEAVHTRIHQRVAIKMLLPDVLEVPDVVSRFEREARAAGKLKSENTTRVLDVDVSESGLPYMVMEFLDGSDLGKIVERSGALPIADAVDFVLEACIAMTEAHAEGVIHRDLKPSNLFVTTLPSGVRRVKVLDFGISKLENETEARVTATQAVVGTPLYMSPEQVRSAKHVDARSDIWSLGIILYELIAGRTPFEGSTTAAAAAICIDPPPPLATYRQGVPEALERAILVALQKTPSARFPSVQALASAIAPFGSGNIRIPESASGHVQTSYTSLPNLHLEIESARTLPHAELGPRAAGVGTLPGWTTRSSPRARRARWVVALVVGACATVSVAFVVRQARQKPPVQSDTSQSAAAALRVDDSAAGGTSRTPGDALQGSSSASVSGTEAVPSASLLHMPSTDSSAKMPQQSIRTWPHTTATATANVTPPTTHSAAPSPTRL
jgi:serine/threonine-protein kinase